MAARLVELRLRVKYEKPGRTIPTHQECHDALEFFMEHALLTGLLSGETDLVVDDHRYEIDTIDISQEDP